MLCGYCPTDTFSRGFADTPHDQNVIDLPLYCLSLIYCRNTGFDLRRLSGLPFDINLHKNVHVPGVSFECCSMLLEGEHHPYIPIISLCRRSMSDIFLKYNMQTRLRDAHSHCSRRDELSTSMAFKSPPHEYVTIVLRLSGQSSRI